MNGFNPKLPNLTCVIATVINIEMNEIDIVEIKIVSSLALKSSLRLLLYNMVVRKL